MELVPISPQLSFAFEIRSEVGTPLELGRGPQGMRRIVNILGGKFQGSSNYPDFNGQILPGGADWQILRDDGVTELDTRYTLQTAQGQLVYVQNVGIRHAAPETLKKLMAGELVDPSLVYFRTTPVFETSAPELQWLTRSTFVGMGERYPAEVVIRFWRVD